MASDGTRGELVDARAMLDAWREAGADRVAPVRFQFMDALERHFVGDWGDLTEQDWRENEYAVDRDLRLFSAYQTEDGTRFWIITEADRSVTTLLLPSEY